MEPVSLATDNDVESASKESEIQAQHSSFIGLIITQVDKIKKECKSRRYRDLQENFVEIEKVLTKFKDADWPLKGDVAPPEWMSIKEKSESKEAEPESVEENVNDNDTVETSSQLSESIASFNENDISKSPSKNSLVNDATAPFNDSDITEAEAENSRNVQDEIDNHDETEEKEKSSADDENDTIDDHEKLSENVEDLSNTESASASDENSHPSYNDIIQVENMSPSIFLTIQHLFTVMNHPQKTAKMCELCLDCITTLASNGYISGQVGGNCNPFSSQLKDEKGEDKTVQEVETTEKSGTSETHEKEENSKGEKKSKSFLQYILENVTKCSESSADNVQISMSKTLLSLITSPKCGIHEADMLTVVRSVFHVYLVSKSLSSKSVAKATLIDILRSIFSRLETYSSMLKTMQIDLNGHRNSLPRVPVTEDSVNNEFISQFHKDGFLLFRALCKLSAKSLPGEDSSTQSSTSKILQSFSTSVDPLAMQSKILSLELILFIFEHCGEAFRKGDKFIYAVQHYLCVSLLKNCTSSRTKVAFQSLKVFLAVVYNFKSDLKSEIEIFLADIFLKVLKSPNSSYEQKGMLIEALRALCAEPSILTQIFLNYDCDFDAINLYKDIVHSLTGLCTKGTPEPTMSKKDLSQEAQLKTAGLEVLVVILQAFLKALGLPGADEELNTNSAVQKLDIENVVSSRSDIQPVINEKQDITIFTNDIHKKVMPEENGDAANMAAKVVGAFDRKRIAQQNFETGLVKFKLSMKGGILSFIKNGFVDLDAKSLADFFHAHKDQLDKTQIGEALGKEPEYAFVKDKDAEAETGGLGFFVRVLHHYVNAMDFTGMEFDEAIRSFLSGFRLPGEAQKIDRIMEKFAECYTRQNEDVFASADTAFILGFSVIMLNTDLHNPNIKPEKKMTKNSFIKMNRGISVDGSDLPEDILIGIFNRIQKHPFTLKEDDDARAKVNTSKDMFSFDSSSLFDSSNFFGSNIEDRKREKFRKERDEIMNASEQLFRKRPSKVSSSKDSAQLMELVSPADVVKPMFDVTWGPVLGAFSQILEKTDDSTCISLCLNGFIFAIRLASHSDMSVARETFVNSLAKFTTLGSIKEMKKKNIECIRTLLSIAIIDGDRLAESWGPILQCISQLGRLTLSASGLRRDDEFLLGEEDEKTGSTGFFRNSSSAEIARETEENNGRAIVAAVNEVLMEKVFSLSVNLSGHGIVHFIEQLVKVSATEIDGESSKGITGVSSRNTINKSRHSGHDRDSPRIFSLQKLVEVAGYNMDVRSRISWTPMWEILAKHFATIGCHKNSMVSMFAIDALRQLSFKFLAKPELSDFNFQRLFLRPFLVIMENPGSREDIRELILQCVDNMIRMMSKNLRSGWKIFLSIITLSATDSYEKINTLGLAILQRILDEHLGELCRIDDEDNMEDLDPNEVSGDDNIMSNSEKRRRNAKAEDFLCLCRASLAFMQVEISEKEMPIGLSMRALCHIACYSDLIAAKKVQPPILMSQTSDPSALGYTYDGLCNNDAEEMALWRPMLDGLKAGISSPLKSKSGGVGCLIQRASIMTLRAILLRHGNIFSSGQWAVILQHVLIPAIDFAVLNDKSVVSTIVSESPIESNLQFLSYSIPLPPPLDDEGLQKFAQVSQSEESAPRRPFGPAELLVEASFADLRHGGDGDLSLAYRLTDKGYEGNNVHDRPFQDSWIATTAPIAVGTLTDVLYEHLIYTEQEGRSKLWPIVWDLYKRWVLGPDFSNSNGMKYQIESGNENHDNLLRCEAIVRIGCKEINRAGRGMMKTLVNIDASEAAQWWDHLSRDLSSIISQNTDMQNNIREELVSYKLHMLGLTNGKQKPIQSETSTSGLTTNTVFGPGTFIPADSNVLENGTNNQVDVPIRKISLEWGGTLYSPEGNNVILDEDNTESDKENGNTGNNTQGLSRENYLDRYIPALKVRSIASHMLLYGVSSYASGIVCSDGKKGFSNLLASLEKSRVISKQLKADEDLAHAFQESWRSEWGDGVLEVELALAAMGGNSRHQGGSDVYFLTQEASSNKAIIHILSHLYCSQEILQSDIDLDESIEHEILLIERIVDILEKFLESEAKDSDLIDPSIWKNKMNMVNQSGKIAVYCTSFFDTVLDILELLIGWNRSQFERNKEALFPLLCSLVKVQSADIRILVHDILLKQVGPLIAFDTK